MYAWHAQGLHFFLPFTPKSSQYHNSYSYSGLIAQRKNCKWCTAWHSTQTIPRDSLFQSVKTVSWYIHKGNIIYAHKKSMAFCLLIHMSHKHLGALCAYLHPNWIVNVASKDKNTFMPLRKCRFHCTNFYKTHYQLIIFCGYLLYLILSKLHKCKKYGKTSFIP